MALSSGLLLTNERYNSLYYKLPFKYKNRKEMLVVDRKKEKNYNPVIMDTETLRVSNSLHGPVCRRRQWFESWYLLKRGKGPWKVHRRKTQ